MRTNTLEKVLETLATSDKTTLVCEKQPDGKLRVTSVSWEGEKAILRDQAHGTAPAPITQVRVAVTTEVIAGRRGHHPEAAVRDLRRVGERYA